MSEGKRAKRGTSDKYKLEKKVEKQIAKLSEGEKSALTRCKKKSALTSYKKKCEVAAGVRPAKKQNSSDGQKKWRKFFKKAMKDQKFADRDTQKKFMREVGRKWKAQK